jgi:protein-arginine kinase activator protein McsA
MIFKDTIEVRRVLLSVFDAFRVQISTSDKTVARAKCIHFGKIPASQKLHVNRKILSEGDSINRQTRF